MSTVPIGDDLVVRDVDGATEDELSTAVDSYAEAGPLLVTLADVEPEPVSWLWPGRLPLGKQVVLDGDPSLGKSTLAVDFSARVSTGRAWPDGSACPLGDVLILSAEDGLADTIRPRLDAAGGDPRRVHALTGVSVRDDNGAISQRPITLADTGVIAAAVKRHRAKLVVVDVLMAYLPTRTDSHRDQDVRAVLARLATVAEDSGCCVLLLRHLNKSSGGNPLYRGGGSIGIVGAARAAYVVAVDPDDESRRVLACTKNNLAPMPPSLAYRLAPADNGTARVEWLGQSDANAANLLALAVGEDERTERDEAVEWLVNHLNNQGGNGEAGAILKAAAAVGISKTTLHRARKRAGVTTSKGGLTDPWSWQIAPGRFHQGSKGSSSQDRESSESSVKPSDGRDTGTEARCTVCAFPLNHVLAAAGETTHATCEPT